MITTTTLTTSLSHFSLAEILIGLWLHSVKNRPIFKNRFFNDGLTAFRLLLAKENDYNEIEIVSRKRFVQLSKCKSQW